MNRAAVFSLAITSLFGSTSAGAFDAEFDRGVLSELAAVVPETEKYIHIGGGFFSYFENRAGSLKAVDSNAAGAVRFRLEEMRWESPFVYLPQGELAVTLHDGTQLALHMGRLDYVTDPATGRLLYRLSAYAGDDRLILIGDCPNAKSGGRPVLVGELHLLHNGREIFSSFRMPGRNGSEAERHLNGYIYMRSNSSESL